MNIIEWCNTNVGFVNAILSISTLFISCIAIVCSIKVAYIPYKKRIQISPTFGIKNDKFYLELIIANSGNKLIGISSIIVYYRDTDIGTNFKQKFVEPSKTEYFFIDMDLKQEEIKYDKNAIVKIEICDTEDKKYKFKVGLVMG